MKPLGHVQRKVLSQLQLDLSNNGCWDPIKPPWTVHSKYETLRALKSLVRRGLVIEEQRRPWPPLYRLKGDKK